MTDKQKNKEMEKRVVHFHNTQATKLKSKSYAVTCHINEEMSKSTTQYQIPVKHPLTTQGRCEFISGEQRTALS